jgi:hypothetical protein
MAADVVQQINTPAMSSADVMGGKALQMKTAEQNPATAITSIDNTKVVQRVVKARKMGEYTTSNHKDIPEICTKFGIKLTDLVEPIKNKLFAGNLFPDSYKNRYDASPELQNEMRKIVSDLSDLVSAANSNIEISANNGDGTAVGDQLYAIIGGSINQARLNRYDHYLITTQLGANAASATTYINLLDTLAAKIVAYKKNIDQQKYDQETLATNSRMENRIDTFKDSAKKLKDDLKNALHDGNSPAAIIGQIQQLVNEVDSYEKAWDLDWGIDALGVNDDVDTLSQDPRVGDHYQEDGGVDDKVSVSDKYLPVMACSLFSILALKGTWLGTDDPKVLHGILRKTGQIKEYDDNKTAAKVRYLAGLKPTPVGGGIKLRDYIQGKKDRGEKDSFIVDAAGIAHTFAAVWKDNDYKKVDETGSNGNLAEYAQNEVLCVWK